MKKVLTVLALAASRRNGGGDVEPGGCVVARWRWLGLAWWLGMARSWSMGCRRGGRWRGRRRCSGIRPYYYNGYYPYGPYPYVPWLPPRLERLLLDPACY